MIPPFSHCVAPGCLVALALYVAVLSRRRRSGPHPPGCPCVPCRDLEANMRDACLVVAAEVMPGPGPRDGKPLNRAQWRVLRGIEAASSKSIGVQQ